jgi:hypothetical protein
MDCNYRYRLRVEHCIGTIIDVHKSLSEEYDNQEFLSQFEELKEAIEDLDMDLVCEGDVLMVEQATNALLGEFKEIFEGGEMDPIYGRPKN